MERLKLTEEEREFANAFPAIHKLFKQLVVLECANCIDYPLFCRVVINNKVETHIITLEPIITNFIFRTKIKTSPNRLKDLLKLITSNIVIKSSKYIYSTLHLPFENCDRFYLYPDIDDIFLFPCLLNEESCNEIVEEGGNYSIEEVKDMSNNFYRRLASYQLDDDSLLQPFFYKLAGYEDFSYVNLKEIRDLKPVLSIFIYLYLINNRKYDYKEIIKIHAGKGVLELNIKHSKVILLDEIPEDAAYNSINSTEDILKAAKEFIKNKKIVYGKQRNIK